MNKKDRRDAVLLCAVMASNNDFFPGACAALELSFVDPPRDLYIGASWLARMAFWATGKYPSVATDNDLRERWAEAEAMLQTGWKPAS